MRSRWFHKPLLHSPSLGLEKKPTWLELFYDLIFVAAFIQLGNGLSGHVSVEGFLTFAATFVALWVAWTGFTFFENRYTLDDFTHRIVVFLQMFAVGGMAIGAPLVLSGDTAAFSLAAGSAQILVGVMYFRAWRQVPEARDYSRYWGLVFGAAGFGWVLAAFIPGPGALALWAVSTLAILAAPLSRQSRQLSLRFPIDFEHLGERYGLLTIIVLGESFVKVLSSLVAEGAGLEVYLQAGLTLLLTCGVWWVYFDDVAGSHVRKGPGQWILWLYAHIPLQIAVTALGVGIKKAVHFSWDAPAPAGYRWLLAGSLALVYFSVAAIDSVTERRDAELSDRTRVNVRWGSALLLLLLAPAGATMSGGTFFVLVAVVNVGQVLFDMMMAPFESSEHLELGKRTTADIVKERVAKEEWGETAAAPVRRTRRPIEDTLRKGTPSALRRDLYFYFMEGSWTRVFFAFGFVFVLSNVFFAALYTLEPNAIENARPDSFADAFFFSVQTMSTIGYGTLTPASSYGNIVATAEAAISLLALTLITGLIFAKASRPQSSVLFSKCMTVTKMHGKRFLMFRAGNARGNEVVDATVWVTALKEELSPEGHHFRRLRDAKLERTRSPLFLLSWTVMHEIDDDSPFADVDWADPEKTLVTVIVTITGHDGTYGQTVYSRHNYEPDEIQQGRRFVDVVQELDDGRMMVDYTLFHDTEPDPDA